MNYELLHQRQKSARTTPCALLATIYRMAFASLFFFSMSAAAQQGETPSLDELLDLDAAPKNQNTAPEARSTDSTTEAPPPQGREALELFKQAVGEMDRVAGHLDDRKDAGPVPQRMQQEIIRKLEQLIAAAQKAGGA